MNSRKYRKISKMMDELLLESNVKKERICIPWLHMLKEHPLFFNEYDSSFNFNKSFRRYFINKLKYFQNKLKLLITLFDSIYNSKEILNNLNVDSPKDVLFVSHLLNMDHNAIEEDFYFSDISSRLKKAGYNSIYLLFNHTNKKIIYNKKTDFKSCVKVILPKTIGFFKEFSNLKKLIVESKKLLKQSKVEKNSFKKNIYYLASQEALTPSTLKNMRLANIVEEVIKKTDPKIIITTYEGHSWERIVYYSAKKNNPSIRCIGYLHAPLFKNQHALGRLLNSSYNPDYIFTSGNIQKSILIKEKILNGIPIKVFGSARHVNQGNILKSSMYTNKFKKRNICLVIPEGLLSEIQILFEFCIDYVKKYSNVEFIWRLHPLFSFSQLRRESNFYDSLPKNIKISHNNIEDDMRICNYVLYRGSSAVIQSIIFGLKPIYLNQKKEINIDPLFDMDCWKAKVEKIEDLNKVFINSFSKQDSYTEAKNYCIEYFCPINEQPILDLLRKN